MLKELASPMAVHEHTYGRTLEPFQRGVINAHVIMEVQAVHPLLLVTTTTVSLETRTAALPATFYMLMILSGMAKGAAQRVLVAAMDDFLHGLM
jgi:hypothetical protein